MLSQNTVLIVGAGASEEFGMPLGFNLRNQIAKATSIRFRDGYSQSGGDKQLWNDIKILCRKRNVSDHNIYRAAAERIAEGMAAADSIDEFIERAGNEIIVDISKLAISRIILQSEKHSKLWYNAQNDRNDIDFDSLLSQPNWLSKLFSKLKSNVNANNIEALFDGLSIVSFNYDRCIEQYFFHLIKRFWGISERDSFHLVKKLKIIHPYGKIAKYAPVSGSIENGCVSYGDVDTNIVEIYENIKTYSEFIDSSVKNQIDSMIEASEKVVFLGCHYHRQNILAISPKNSTLRPSVYGTASGYKTEEDIDHIRSELAATLVTSYEKIRIVPLKCAELFENYQRGMIV